MATSHGKSGQVRVGANQVGSVRSWNFTYDPGWADTGYLGDSFGAQKAGLARGNGTVEVDTDVADTNGQVAMTTAVTGGTTVALYLYLTAASYWHMQANLDLVETVDIGQMVRRTFNFRNNGTIGLV